MKHSAITDSESLIDAFFAIDRIHEPDADDLKLIEDVLMLCLADEQEKGLESIEVLDTYYYNDEKKYGREYWGHLYLTHVHYKDKDMIVPFIKVNGQASMCSPVEWVKNKPWTDWKHEEILDKVWNWRSHCGYIPVFEGIPYNLNLYYPDKVNNI